jgi:hypothetical protein
MPRWKARSWWILVLLLLLIAAAAGFRSWSIQRDVAQWEDYRAHCRATGQDLGVESWLPAPVPDEDNVFRHPWMSVFLDSETSPQAEAVAKMRSRPGLDLEGYEGPSDGKSWFDGREAEAAGVLQSGKEQAADLKAIHEVAARVACQPPVDLGDSTKDIDGPWTRVSDLGPMLALHADAAMASGDASLATAHLEAMLRFGNHLRGGNFLLVTVMGVLFENRAAMIIDVGLSRQLFRPQDRRRLLAAMRTRPVPDEMVAAMRVERGIFLASLEGEVTKGTPIGFKEKFAAFLNPPRRLVATDSLHFCRMLEGILASGASRGAWEDFGRHIHEVSRGEVNPTIEISVSSLVMTNLAESLFVHEDYLDLLRQNLAE